MKTAYLHNKRMNNEVYLLRRKVIALIYEAKKLVDLPRIDVRITDNHSLIAGAGRVLDNKIWITENFVASRAVVFHEILHAVFGVPHVDGCPLMAPICSNPSDAVCNQLFVKYAKTFKEFIK